MSAGNAGGGSGDEDTNPSSSSQEHVTNQNGDIDDHKANNKDNTTTTEAERNFYNPNHPPIYKFVMTGGPCGGKTTALARLFSFLRERGFEVITCPEAYTLLSSNGMSPHLFATEGMPFFIQSAVFDTMMTLENSVMNVLKARGKPGVILCDRGSMDNTVYLGMEKFAEILQQRNTDIVQVRDNRYDAIFHMVTAADGALPYYTLENNAVRTETPQEAIEVDHRTQKAWVGHPHLYVIDNSTDFEGKMSRLVDVICKIVGLPSNLRRRSVKFLLQNFPTDSVDDLAHLFPENVHFQMFDVEKVYLQRIDDDGFGGCDDDDEDSRPQNYSFVRKRSVVNPVDGSIMGSVYQSTQVTKIVSSGEVVEQKRIISHREYLTALLSRDKDRNIVQQRRISFLWQLRSFVIHIYQKPISGLAILHAQVETTADEKLKRIELPPFLQVVRQLQDTPEDEEMYGAYSISKMDYAAMADLQQSTRSLSLAQP